MDFHVELLVGGHVIDENEDKWEIVEVEVCDRVDLLTVKRGNSERLIDVSGIGVYFVGDDRIRQDP